MTLADYLRAFRRTWWVVVVLALVGAAAGAGVAYLITPTFTAKSTIFVSTVDAGSLSDLQQGQAFATQRADSYAGLATTTSVLSGASSSLGAGVSTSALRRAISAEAREDTSLIDITASGRSASLVADEANAVAASLATAIGSLDTAQTTTTENDGVQAPAAQLKVTVVQTATQPRVAAAPQPRNATITGGIVGLAVGLAIIILAASLDRRIRTLADLPRSIRFASRTAIPSSSGSRRSGADAREEAFRSLRANLQFGADAGPVIAVAGLTRASATVEVADRLGGAFAETGARVVVVDADLGTSSSGSGRRSTAGRAGLADALLSSAPLSDIVERGDASFDSIGPGSSTRGSAQLISTAATREFLTRLSQHYDYVILRAPALVERSDAAVIAALAQTCVVVVEAAKAKSTDLRFGLELLDGVGVDSVAIAVDHIRRSDLGASGHDAEVTTARGSA